MTNTKLVDRGTRYIMEGLNVEYAVAEQLLMKHGSVKKALDAER